MRSKMALACAGLCITLAGLAAGRSYFLAAPAASSDRPDRVSGTIAAERAREMPLAIRPFPRQIIPASRRDDEWIRGQIRPPVESKELSPSFCLHILRANGLQAQFTNLTFPTSESLLKPLIDSKEGERIFGKAALITVPTGVRYLTRTPPDEPRWREYHRDQNLASFGELGLPLSTQLTIEGKQVPLRLLLQDSIANFHLQQRELEWTGIAYALYLPPVAGWTNRFGEQYTFDDLSMSLLDRPSTGASCGGMHVLYTLMVIARADAESPVLSQSVRSKVENRLQYCAKLAVDRQKSDGSWAGDWLLGTELSRDYTGPSPPATPDHQLLITGHTAEWLLYLPRDFRVPDETLKRAGHWLLARLKKLDANAKKAQLCPCTHAVCVLQNLSFPEGASGVGSLGHGIDPAWAERVRVSFRVPRTED